MVLRTMHAWCVAHRICMRVWIWRVARQVLPFCCAHVLYVCILVACNESVCLGGGLPAFGVAPCVEVWCKDLCIIYCRIEFPVFVLCAAGSNTCCGRDAALCAWMVVMLCPCTQGLLGFKPILLAQDGFESDACVRLARDFGVAILPLSSAVVWQSAHTRELRIINEKNDAPTPGSSPHTGDRPVVLTEA